MTIKVFSKQKILNKPLANRKNKRKPKNWKNRITGKIKVKAVCVLAKPVLSTIKLSKNNTALGKRVVELHTSSKDAILSFTEKKGR